jgi:hypothetical protein
MRCIERTRQILLAWLDTSDARVAQRAVESTGIAPDVLRTCLRRVTEDAGSADPVVSLIADGRRHASLPAGCVIIERWLLVRQAIEALGSAAIENLGDTAQRMTCDEIAALVHDDHGMRTMLDASSIRFREFVKLVTGRRFCAGLFFWEECGLRRSWLAKVPRRDWIGFGRTLIRMGGLGPMMFPHMNPRCLSARIEAPAVDRSLAVMAESLERRPELRGFAAASWLRSPDTHRVSPHLAVVNRPILAHGGFVTTVGAASPDCGIFERSRARRRLYEYGSFAPTIGLVLWPRADMLGYLGVQRAEILSEQSIST